LAGELDRRDRKEPVRVIPKTMISHKNIFKKPIFTAGIVFLGVWLILYRTEIWANLNALSSNWVLLALGGVATAIASLIALRWEITSGKKKGEPIIV
jgi:branched-subunit amino acid ABC-type transport system permease component